MTQETHYTSLIYRNPEKQNRFYCKVIAGNYDKLSFETTKILFEIPLNGPGMNKANRKILGKLRDHGLLYKLSMIDLTNPRISIYDPKNLLRTPEIYVVNKTEAVKRLLKKQ